MALRTSSSACSRGTFTSRLLNQPISGSLFTPRTRATSAAAATIFSAWPGSRKVCRSSRRREVAIRTALGASTVRVVRQFVTEAVVLVAFGTLLALVAAYGAVQLLTSLVPADIMAGMPFLRDLGMNPRVAAFAGVLAVA